ncbi:TIGR03899 family protein [Thalassotalea atypica]|uniref:TIGR03899 family protein n=1 Tax=Thalassotalea atypica TaxID=2054316 RepID=UPI002574643C|nr:TIGR03899 family protein [Thalassotalea atypica]
MTTDNNCSTHPVTIDVEPESSNTTNENQQSKKSASSTQVQLLNLAKNFGLADSLKPENKQLPIEERMLKRDRYTHLRKQSNMEAIIEKSIKYCSEHVASSKADPDWFSNFIELAENISNNVMQDLWAKILAGEISNPGSFSLKTLRTFKNLAIHDAKLLAKACAVAVKDKSKRNIRLLSGSYQKPGLFNLLNKQRAVDFKLSEFGLGYGEILALSDNNLLYAQETELAPMAKGDEIALRQGGSPIILRAKKNGIVLRFYKFTVVGVELAQLIGDKPDEELLTALKIKLSHHFDS